MSDLGQSQARACRPVGVDLMTVRRQKKKDNLDIRKCMREIARVPRRFGCRRINLMPERDGMYMNHNTLRHLNNEGVLAMKQRKGRKHATGTRALTQPRGSGHLSGSSRKCVDLARSHGKHTLDTPDRKLWKNVIFESSPSWGGNRYPGAFLLGLLPDPGCSRL